MRVIAKSVARLVVLVALCAIVPLPALAQGVGAIGGTVTDSSGGVLPGVTVTLSNPGTIGGNQNVVSDERGTYRFTRLVPGRYSVKAELAGFQTAVQENLVVDADKTSRADLKLAVGQISEQMTVTGEAPLLDTTSAARQIVMPREVIDSLPGRNDIYSIGRMAPAVMINKYDVGGASALQSNAFVHGSIQAENAYMIDGLDISNPTGAGGGSSAGRFDPFMFQEINYQLGNTPAERPIGGVIYNMITKTGTNTFHATYMYSGAVPAWTSDNISPAFRTQLLAAVPANVLAGNPTLRPNADIVSLYDTAATIGGPIVKDRLWFVGGAKKNFLNQNQLGSYNLNGQETPDDNQGRNLWVKGSWQVDTKSQLHYMHLENKSAQLHRRAGTGIAATDFIETRVTAANDTEPRVNQARFTRVMSSKVVTDVSASYMKSATGGPPQQGVQNGDIPRYDSVLKFDTVAAPFYITQSSARVNIIASVSYATANHDLKAGYYFNHGFFRNQAYSLSNYPAGYRAVYRSGVPDSVNTYNTPVDYSEYHHENSLFIQDRWTPVRKLTLSLGLRFQTTEGWEPATCQTQTIFIDAQCFPATTGIMTWKNVGPRLSAIYDLSGDGRTALKFSANRYYPIPGAPYVDLVNPIKQTSDTRAWTVCAAGQTSGCDLNGDKTAQVNEFGPSTGFNLGTTNRLDPNVKAPNVDEFSAGIERQLPGAMVVSASYIYRSQKNQIGPTNLAVPLSSYTPIQVTEVASGRQVTVYNQDAATRGKFDVLYSNLPQLDNSFKGVDLTFTKRMSRHWMAFGGLSLGKSDGDIYSTFNGVTGDLNNPNLINRRGVIGMDVPVSFKASGAYELPFGIGFSAGYQHFAGAPELTTVLIGATTVRLTQVSQSLVVEPSGTTRLPSLDVTDISFRKTVRLGRLKAEPILDAYNLFNAATVTGRTSQLGPTYGQVNSIMRGRVIKLGVNMGF